jgi:hypothetical protein
MYCMRTYEPRRKLKLNYRVTSLYGIKYAWLIATEKDKHGGMSM